MYPTYIKPWVENTADSAPSNEPRYETPNMCETIQKKYLPNSKWKTGEMVSWCHRSMVTMVAHPGSKNQSRSCSADFIFDAKGSHIHNNKQYNLTFFLFSMWIVRKHFHNEILLPDRYYMCFDGRGIFWHNSFSRTTYTGASCQKDLIHKDLRLKSWVLLWLKKWHLTGFCQGIFWSGICIVLVGTTWLRG